MCKKKKNKGFTLVEILTVVIILGAVVSIIFPIVKKIIVENRLKGFKASLDGVIRSTEMYISANAVNYDTLIGFDDDKIKSDNNNFISGTVKYQDGKITLNGFSDGQYCANGESNKYKVEERKCASSEVTNVPVDSCFEFDTSSGTITRYNYNNAGCSNSIIVPEKIKNVYVKHIGEHAFIRGVDLANYYIFGQGKYINAVYTDIIENIASPISKEYLKKVKTPVPDKSCYYSLSNTNPMTIPYKIIGDGTDFLFCKVSASQFEDYNDYDGVISVDLSYAKELETIDKYAFMGGNVEKLTFGNLPRLESIGRLAFDSNSLTGTLDLSGLTGLKKIDDYAFSENSLDKLILPTNITEIGNYSFYNDGISETDFSHTKLTIIGDNAFKYNNLTTATMPSTLKTLGVRSFAHNYIRDLSLNSGLKSIKESAFCQNEVPTLVIPDSVDDMGISAFFSNRIENLTIGAGITTIPLTAFRYNHIGTLNVPSTVSSIGPLAFADNALRTLNIASSSTVIGGGAFNRNHLDNDKCIIRNGNTLISYACFVYDASPVQIPSTITVIGDYALDDIILSNITLPDAVTTIGYKALEAALKDSSSVLNIGSNVTSIDETAFTCVDIEKCGYTININRAADAITGKPWGNTFATIKWNGSV